MIYKIKDELVVWKFYVLIMLLIRKCVNNLFSFNWFFVEIKILGVDIVKICCISMMVIGVYFYIFYCRVNENVIENF